MNTNKLLTTVAVIAFSVGLTACSALKPDHPQVRESFKERRAPRDNMLAASGALVEQKSSNFQPINQSQVVERPAAAAPTQAMPAMNVDAMQNAIQPSATTAPATGKEAPAGFFDRLFKKFSSTTTVAPASVKMARKPIDNNDFEQGSTSVGYSYYDMANEVLPAHPVPQVREAVVKTISSDFGYLTAPSRGYNVINVAQAQDAAPVVPPVAPSVPAAPVAPAPTTAPVMVAPAATTASAPVTPTMPVVPPAVPAPSAAPAAPAAPVMSAPTEPVPQAPELPRMDPATTPVATPAAPKPMNEPKVEMPKAPEIPANEQIKATSEKLPEPELKEVPAKPAEQPKASVEPQPPMKKAVKRAVKKVNVPKKESGDPYTEKPIPAEISRQLSGDEKVTGYLK